MTTATAWLLPVTDQFTAAIGEFELVHILPELPVFFPVPCAPAYCSSVILWQDKLIPVMDLAQRFQLTNSQKEASTLILGIVVFWLQDKKTVEYGALRLSGIPNRCTVDDAQVRPLPDNIQHMSGYIQSCFENTQNLRTVPVLHMGQLFSSP